MRFEEIKSTIDTAAVAGHTVTQATLKGLVAQMAAQGISAVEIHAARELMRASTGEAQSDVGRLALAQYRADHIARGDIPGDVNAARVEAHAAKAAMKSARARAKSYDALQKALWEGATGPTRAQADAAQAIEGGFRSLAGLVGGAVDEVLHPTEEPRDKGE